MDSVSLAVVPLFSSFRDAFTSAWRGTFGCIAVALALSGPNAVGRSLPQGPASAVVDSWNMESGLPQDTVTALVQTRDSYLWVGTDGGLARFDGLKFTTFRTTNTPGLTSHAVTALFEDRAGDLWIGTENGLMCYRQGRFDAVGLEGREITAVCEDSDGGLWIGTDGGIYRHRGGAFESLAGDTALPGGAVRSILADSAGRVWIGFTGSDGLIRYENGAAFRAGSGDELRGEVLAIAEQPRGTLWFGTSNGLVQFKDGRYTRFGPEHGLAGRRVTDLYGDKDGGLWIANSALQKITGSDFDVIETTSPTDARSFRGLVGDREGNIWVGAPGEGLIRMRPATFQLIGLEARSISNGFRTVMQDGAGTLFLAQGSLGYSRITPDKEIHRLLPRSEAPGDEVLAVYVSRDGGQWVGTRDALEETREGKTTVHPQFAGMRSMFEDRSGTMWFGSQNGGIVRWRAGVFSPAELPEAVARCTPGSFAENAAGDIWVGTWSHGVLQIRGDTVTVHNRDTGLPTNEMRFVFVDREDRLWVGSRGRGLAVLDEGQWLVPEWTSELLDQQVISIIDDTADNLWLALPRGVFVTSRRELLQAMRSRAPTNRLRIVHATEGLRQGLADLSCFPSAWRTQEGHIWFATRRGIMRVNSTPPPPNAIAPTVHIERVVVNGSRQAVADEIVLPPDTHGLVLEYTALSFSAPGRVRFRYQLEGVDEDWVEADDRRTARYSKLAPGRYRFRVIACNADGVWNHDGAAITFVQEAHLYEEPWVLWLLGVMLVGSVTGIYRWRMVAHARERRRLETGIAERTRDLRIAKEQAEASTQAKAEFLESISHEIRNPLNGIIGLVAMLREAPLDARERELAQSLGACAKGLARVFDEVLNFSKLEHGYVPLREKPFTLGALVEEVAALFRMMARQRGSEIVVRREGTVPDHWIGDGEKIKSILGNFVNNALKYAPGSPVEILVQCEALDEFGADLTFNVTDRGPGIPPEEQERIFEKFVRGSNAREQRTPGTGLGLATCRALAELMGGHVAVESESGRGATFFLRLRLKRDRNPAPAAEPLPVELRSANGGRALIVEDQPYNQIVVRRIAERLGFATDVTSDAEAALARLARQPYAIVFLDWEIPGTNGAELARCIRQLPRGGDPIVIATTAHDSDKIRRECLAAGMDAFALKPFESETIARLIDEARTRRGAPAGAPAALDTRVFRFVGYDDPEQAGQAARLYLDILEQEVDLLEAALDQEDPDGAAAAAHRIKSHAGLVDAAELRATADRLQREARSAPAAALAGMHEELIRHAGVLRERLKSWRSEDGDG